jgi:hypothetical protein
VVQGNLDKNVIPDIQAIANEVFARFNNAMLNQGYKRNARSYG